MSPKPEKTTLCAIGLMSGTSLDGVDAALLHTDGQKIHSFGGHLSLEYPPEFQAQLRAALRQEADILVVEQILTEYHAAAVNQLLEQEKLNPQDVDLIGFHGQTIIHRPDEGITWQIGNASLLAELTGINVVSDFRRRDMAAGGQGAPLVPIFHQALMAEQPKPLAVLNIGGVANVTWIGEEPEDLIAFDTGPGNALINDWVHKHTGKAYDENGALAASGEVARQPLETWLIHPYFTQKAPKSLDRNSFIDLISPRVRGDTGGRQLNYQSLPPSPPACGGVKDASLVNGRELSVENGAATLTAFTVETILKAADQFPEAPKHWYICGGGRLNKTIMEWLGRKLGDDKVSHIEALGYNGDMIEAQAFAHLAVRSFKGLPLTFPGTTGVKEPTSGGVHTPH